MIGNRKTANLAAKQTLDILDAGGYSSADGSWVDLKSLQEAAEQGTRLYSPENLEKLRSSKIVSQGRPTVEVIDATTQEAAHRLAAEADVVLLNFASARNPGGGFLGGARAQEEELCRCSGLYRTLITQPKYYTTNRQLSSLLYTDFLIY